MDLSPQLTSGGKAKWLILYGADLEKLAKQARGYVDTIAATGDSVTVDTQLRKHLACRV